MSDSYMSLLFSLADRVAIVTGAGRGLGRAAALGLAQAGADVVVVARTATEVETTGTQVRAIGKRALVVRADVRVSEQVADMVRRTLAEFGRVDILVNNVGGAFLMPVSRLTEEDWDSLIVRNLKTCFLCSKAVADTMIQQRKGSIINIASTEALRAAPFNAAYGAAKAGVINLTQSLAVELAQYNIRVNAIIPGFIESPGLPKVLENYPLLRNIFERIPLGRAAKPENVAGTIVYLASDASDYVTGSIFTVDGGLTSLLG